MQHLLTIQYLNFVTCSYNNVLFMISPTTAQTIIDIDGIIKEFIDKNRRVVYNEIAMLSFTSATHGTVSGIRSYLRTERISSPIDAHEIHRHQLGRRLLSLAVAVATNDTKNTSWTQQDFNDYLLYDNSTIFQYVLP